MKNNFFKTSSTLARQSVFALVALVSTLPTQAQPTAHKALALGWNSYADTNLQFSEFFGGDHTIALRVMFQYPSGYEGPMLAENSGGAENGGTFFLGQGDWWANPIGPKLMLTVGNHSQVYRFTLAAAPPGTWHDLAMTATHNGATRIFTLYLDGAVAGPPLTVMANELGMPTGMVRFGKRTTGQTVNLRNAQFYGLLDDIAIFTYVLAPVDIQSLINHRVSGYERGLLAGFTFDDGNLPVRFSRPVTLGGATQRVVISDKLHNNADATAIPLPSQETEITLPFKHGEAWTVVQGFDNANGSHKGYADFCWDFILADKPPSAQATLYPNGSKNAPFYAAAPGPVVTVYQDSVSGPEQPYGINPPNKIEILQAPGEYAAYLHMPHTGSLASVGYQAERGSQLAVTGDTGVDAGAYHLHFAVTDMKDRTPGFVTYPVAFANYEIRDANGNWHRVLRGVPQYGDVVRVPADPDVRYNAVWRPDPTQLRVQPELSQEMQMEGATYAAFKAGYDQIFPLGWRIYKLQAYEENGQVLYNAVWRPGTSAELQVFGRTYQEYRNTYDGLFPQRWRLYHLQTYLHNGQVLYDAVWRPGNSGEIQIYGANFQAYKSTYDSLFAKGWRLQILQSWVFAGQVFYNAVWRPGSYAETQAYGVSLQNLSAQYNQLWAQGWRLSMLQSYVLNGQVLYNAVWTPSTSGEFHVYGYTYEDYRKKYDELHAQGWVLELLDSYEV